MYWDWLVAFNLAGQNEERKGWAQGFKFPVSAAWMTQELPCLPPKETLLSCSQIWDWWKPNPESHPASGWIKMQTEFPQLQRVSTIKIKALTGKQWDPENWNAGVWEDPIEGGLWTPKFWLIFSVSRGSPCEEINLAFAQGNYLNGLL